MQYLTTEQVTKIKYLLGYQDRFRVIRLEDTFTPEHVNIIDSLLVSLEDTETQLFSSYSKGNLKRVDVIEYDNAQGYAQILMEKSRLLNQLATTIGIENRLLNSQINKISIRSY